VVKLHAPERLQPAVERSHKDIDATMKYAKKNLRAVEDSAVKFGLSKTQEARFPRGDLGAEQTGMNLLTVKPSQREAFAHRHRRAEEIYFVLTGGGRVKLDDELVELAPFDAVRVSPGVTRSFEAGPDGLEVLIVGRTSRATVKWSPTFGRTKLAS
jgi:mannose-6-phosphate isomerase-like protein (cupin superfamily)